LRRSGKGEKGRYLPSSKEEEGAYIFKRADIYLEVRKRRGHIFFE
jgi:hypothetical protein